MADESKVQAQPAALPDGVTNDMLSAGANVVDDPDNERSSWDLAGNVYRAMLAAAPQPSQAEPQQAEPYPSRAGLLDMLNEIDLLASRWHGGLSDSIRQIIKDGPAFEQKPDHPAPTPVTDERVLLDEHVRGIIQEQTGFEFLPGELQTMNDVDLINIARAIERAALSQVKETAVTLTPGDAEVKLGSPECPWTSLLAYVLQDEMHNRLTPRVIDIAHTAFMQAKAPNDEDGGPSDWFNDTRPKIKSLIENLRTKLFAERDALAQQGNDAERLLEVLQSFPGIDCDTDDVLRWIRVRDAAIAAKGGES